MPRRHRTGRPRRRPIGAGFRRLVAAHLVSNLGDGISLVAYPWLASSLTRNPILIIGVLFTQRLPWLFFSLPVGVLVDRRDRRNLMIVSDVARAALTAVVVLAVLREQSGLPTPDELAALDPGATFPTRTLLLVMLLAATFLLGVGEVLHDNAALTLLPQIVEADRLEEANGHLVTVERAANQFGGPLLGAFLLSSTFVLPFLIDAVTFALSAVILTLITVRPVPVPPLGSAEIEPPDFRRELISGYRALRNHRYLSLLALVATVVNLGGGMLFVIMIFFAQEILGTSPLQYAALMIGSAVGAGLGGITAARVNRLLGTGTVLRGAGITLALSLVVLGSTRWWLIAVILMATYSISLSYWRIITVSLRQAITPNHLLGRVNGVYRFFSFGAIPVGAVIGGVLVAGLSPLVGRSFALQAPIVLAGAVQLLLFVVIAPKLDTAKLDAIRAAGPAWFTSDSSNSDRAAGRVEDTNGASS